MLIEQCRPIKLSFLDKLKIFCKYNFPISSKCSLLKFKNDALYDKGNDIVKNELNFFTLLETLNKIKASLSVLINNDENLIKQIHKQYLKLAIIPNDGNQEKYFESQKTKFIKFME